MNTEISPEITRTCSKGHGKIANNNSFRLSRNNIRLQCLELPNNMLQNLTWQTKAWVANTKGKEQNSLNELILKINRKDGSINANMASDMNRFQTVIHGRNRFMIATLQACATHHKAIHGMTR